METPPGLVLASASPRRRELLHLLGLSYQVRPSTVDETLRPGRAAEAEALRLATAKARQQHAGSAAIVVAADTLVALGSAILGKPPGAAEARQMLRLLRGAGHRVVTGVAVARAGQVWADVCVTQVWMRAYTGPELEAFVASGAALDKAGAYAIQDAQFSPVERIQGCYCNVVGLPLGLLLRLLREAAYPVATVPRPAQCLGCPDWPAAGDKTIAPMTIVPTLPRTAGVTAGELPSPREIPCFRCGVCCVRWQPLLSPQELRRMAADLGLSLAVLKRRYTRAYPLRRGWRQLKATDRGCVFLAFHEGRAACVIHPMRPQVCRDWAPSLEQRECRDGLRSFEGPPLLTLERLYPAAEDRRRFVETVTPGDA